MVFKILAKVCGQLLFTTFDATLTWLTMSDEEKIIDIYIYIYTVFDATLT